MTISHAYTKLIDFDLEDPCTSTFITAEPYGYGNDLAQWSNHITKLTVQQKLDDKWTLDGSLRIYWGFPGMKDYDHYSHDTATGGSALLYDSGWEKTYRGNYYLNLGLRYQPTKDLTIGVFGYYLLGIFDKDLNKRNTGYTGLPLTMRRQFPFQLRINSKDGLIERHREVFLCVVEADVLDHFA